MRSATIVLTAALAATLSTAPRALEGAPGAADVPLVLASARVSLDGTSNVHDYTASTSDVRLTAVEIGGTPAGSLLEHVLRPGGLAAFEVVIPAASLASPKDGIDKNMHKALKVSSHPDIRFRLGALEAAGAGYRADGSLTIAGVEKNVVLDLEIAQSASGLSVTGGTGLLMTDFGIEPPKAMLGMVRAAPEVTIRIELLLAAR